MPFPTGNECYPTPSGGAGRPAVGRPSKATTCAMAIMGKASVPGRAKTRLVPPLSAQEAANLNTAFLRDIIGNVHEAAKNCAIDPFIAYGPAGSEQFFRDHVPVSVGLIECSHPDFGDCLFTAVATLLGRGYGAACVVNADSPTLPTEYLVRAAAALAPAGDRAVLGPSTDGGYYLLGLKRPHRRMFDEIAWSTASVGAQTRERAAELRLELVLLDPWYDVDDGATLGKLHEDLQGGAPATPASPAVYGAPRTRAVLTQILAPRAAS